MATIALYANKINQMPPLISDAKKSVSDYKLKLFSLKSKTLTINKSVCDLDDVISSIQCSSQTQEQKIASLETFSQNTEQFITDAARIDSDVADVVKQRKDDFYEKYYYLKPECEKNGWEKFCDGCKAVGEWCKEHWKEITKIIVAVVIIAVLAVATVLTGGAAGGVAGFILAGALKGAIIGGISSAVIGAGASAVSHRLKTGSWKGVADAAFCGAANGLLSGTIIGGITGAAGNAIRVYQAGKLWNPGTFKSGYQSMKYHYNKHVLEEGFSQGNNIVRYTNDALNFANRNSEMLKYTFNYKHCNAVWKFVYDVGQGGTFDTNGRIVQFWYEVLSRGIK